MLMLLPRVSRAPLRLACLLFVTLAAATISPSNTSTAGGQFQGTLPLNNADGSQKDIAALVPLTPEAAQRTIEGNLYVANFSNVAGIASGDIAYISCNPADYAVLTDPQGVFESAFNKANISGVILYSTATDYCDYEQTTRQEMLQAFPVLSMTNKQASASLLASASASLFAVRVQARGDDNSGNGGNGTPINPLGPSPSTAVAMIILYSITGIITALFLVIIVTGAVRAHRHPERYGPRDVLGRPRQSRARGLGRAILDTIPIVKFGEKEPAKSADVELASTAESRDVNGNEVQGTQTQNAVSSTPNETAEATPNTTTSTVEEHEEGIAPAQTVVAAAASGKSTASNDENLGCSICTEDFEMGQDLRVLPCDHKFHPECVDPWLLNVSGTCPLCRVDLRPVTSHDSSASQHTDEPTPSVNPEAETQPHRSAFRDILSLRHRPNATPQERIYYLRRLREQRRNRSGDVADDGAASGSNEDAAERRRSKRLSVRLSGVFSGRTRRERSPAQLGESSRSAAQPPLPRDESPTPAGTDGRQN